MPTTAMDALNISMCEYVVDNQFRTLGENVYERAVGNFRNTGIRVNVWMKVCPITQIIPYILRQSRPINIIESLAPDEPTSCHVDIEPLQLNTFSDDRDPHGDPYGVVWYMGESPSGPFYGEEDCLDAQMRIDADDE